MGEKRVARKRRERPGDYGRLCHDAMTAGYRVALLAEADDRFPLTKRSMLSALVLMDRDRVPIANESMIGDRRIDDAAGPLLAALAGRRGAR